MLVVDLQDVRSEILSSPKTEDRIPVASKELLDFGIKDFAVSIGDLATPYTIGIAQGHVDALSRSLGDPVIIFEDDVKGIPDNFLHTVGLPDDTDALYLGTSTFGMIRGVSRPGAAISSSVDSFSHLLRLYNMLSIHAVLYISDSYKKHIISILAEFISTPELHTPHSIGCDECIANSMKNWNIYGVVNPMYYQGDGHSEGPTTTPLSPYF